MNIKLFLIMVFPAIALTSTTTMLQAMEPQESTLSNNQIDISRVLARCIMPQNLIVSGIQMELIEALEQGNEDEACRLITNHRDKFVPAVVEIALSLGIQCEYYVFTRIFLNLYGDKLSSVDLGDAMRSAVRHGHNSILKLFANTPALFNRIDSSRIYAAAELAYQEGNITAQAIILKAQLRRTCPSCAIL